MPAIGDLCNTEELARRVCAGERRALAQALNLLDDRRAASRQQAGSLLALLWSQEQRPVGRLIGITGPPGAGKSSLSAALIRHWRQQGLTVAVLAVDPSSPITGGALLGDRLRMKTSAEDDGVFVRSLACRGDFGGLSAEVWPMSLVMLAAFDITLIETVGVGQREIDVSGMCDTTCYVAQPGSGDSVQFLKAGILEVPQVLVVNKEDMGAVARRTLSELAAALHRQQPEGHWNVPVLSASATRGTGIETLADALEAHHQYLRRNSVLAKHRQLYQAEWIFKRLQSEFGSFGVDSMGGEGKLRKKLVTDSGPLYEQLQNCRKEILLGWGLDPAS